jgi:hypothetical protein
MPTSTRTAVAHRSRIGIGSGHQQKPWGGSGSLARALEELTAGSSVNVIGAFGGDDALASGALGAVTHSSAVIRDIKDTQDNGEVLGFGRGDNLNTDGVSNHSLFAIDDVGGVLDNAICDIFAVGDGGHGPRRRHGERQERPGRRGWRDWRRQPRHGRQIRFKGQPQRQAFDKGRAHGTHTRVVTTS